MSELLSIAASVELLDRMRETAAEFAAREDSLIREHRTAMESAQRRFDAEAKNAAEGAAARVSALEAAIAAETGQQHERYARGETRLAEAYARARKGAAERIELEEGRRKYRVQKGMLDAEKFQTESLAVNDGALGEFRANLAEKEGALAGLEAAADKAFRGYGVFRKWIRLDGTVSLDDAGRDHLGLLGRLTETLSQASEQLRQFRGKVLPALFRMAPIWVWAVLLLGGAAAAQYGGFISDGPRVAKWLLGGFGAVLALYAAGFWQGRTLAKPLAESIATARSLSHLAARAGESWHDSERTRIKTETRERAAELDREWQSALQAAAAARKGWPHRLETKWRRYRDRHEARYRVRVEAVAADQAARRSALAGQDRDPAAVKRQEFEARTAALEAEHARRWADLEQAWRERWNPLHDARVRSQHSATALLPAWEEDGWSRWQPPTALAPVARLGDLAAHPERAQWARPKDARLALPPEPLSLPLVLTAPNEMSVLIEATGTARDAALATLNNLVFGLLATSRAGKIRLELFDPVGLGRSFAALARLADEEGGALSGRIWTQPDQLEERLLELSEHVEKVLQMYLRNEYATIAEYNRAAGNMAEKYHYLVLADFPAGISELGARRLARIATSGPRCGVYLLVHWDARQGNPPEALLTELRAHGLVLKHHGNQVALVRPRSAHGEVQLALPPRAESGNAFLDRLMALTRGANRVEVPFAQVAPGDGEMWSLETASELRVPIGRAGPGRLQYLAVGQGTRQHVLLSGKTGSGKSTLLHVIVTNLALWCRPDQVEFYLIDFKKGVEFKSYATARLPHARVVAIESDREFGLSVLQRVDEELRRRGELFRRAGVQDIAGYRRSAGAGPMPRTLLLIDEFQEFFVEEDRIAQSANLLLDRIVRQGRAFGIHVMLGSQTLGGAYTLARATMGQMVVRIALQSNEADAYLIMDENNSAPRLLSRPGEGIYNDQAGATAGNSPFQVVWLSEGEREAALHKIRERADRENLAGAAPIVFEGNAPAEVASNSALASLVRTVPNTPPEVARVWLGEPNSIKGPTEAAFRPRSGSNLLIVGQRDEVVLTMLGVAMLALDAQFPQGGARFFLLHSAAEGSAERAFLESVVRTAREEVVLANGDLAGSLAALGDELARRAESRGSGPRIFLIIHGLQNFKKLRPEDEFSFSASTSDGPGAAARLTTIISEGGSHGIHTIASVDTYNNVNRYLGRKGLSEFEMRVLLQMSAADSAALCDDPKASTLGLHRALLYNEQLGQIETFRPYALPGFEWFEHMRSASAPSR